MQQEKIVNTLIDEILKDYEENRIIDRLNVFDQPSKENIIDIIYKLQKIIFPGYFKNPTVRTYTSRNVVAMNLEDVLFNLSKQINIVIGCCPKRKGLNEEERRNVSFEIATEFLQKLPALRKVIESDVEAAYDGDPAAFSYDEIIYSYPGLFTIMVYRLAHELFLLNVPLIPRMMTEYAHSMTGIDIHPGATIGNNFFIDHGTGIVIGETTKIGNNVKIYQGVTLGALSTKGGQALKDTKRHPTIEDNVTIYSNASILGGNTVVGANSVIGGNAFITESIPANSKVILKNQEIEVIK